MQRVLLLSGNALHTPGTGPPCCMVPEAWLLLKQAGPCNSHSPRAGIPLQPRMRQALWFSGTIGGQGGWMNKGNIQDALSEAWEVSLIGLQLVCCCHTCRDQPNPSNEHATDCRYSYESAIPAVLPQRGRRLTDRWPNSSHDAGMSAMGGSPHGSKEKRKVALTESRPGSSLNWRGACRCWAIVLSPIEKTVAGRAAKKVLGCLYVCDAESV
ncbi:hypothetical protein BT67DRAFT_199277 [Trichocladium antarcticum]|uniref:Uncharacterized protein n=1 Tax=Trichocladium antarcticum TaxID=1450529 RepID=A0AAN6ZGS4_9PEZI|nr:hypothetical protein BT67DRAFT_199277 [Trichocladium antarcticum]